MTQNLFYVDSCIYLNLWQKEGDSSKGVPYWKIAKDFFEKFDNEETIIYYSGFLLKEMKFVLTKENYKKKRNLFNSSPNFKKIAISSEELNKARKIESELKYEISFFDIIHLLLSIKTKSILVTRDRKLLDTAKRYQAAAKRPEELL